MPYIGKQPASVPVTAADIPDNSITSAKILDGVITIADIGADAVGLSELSASGTASNTTFLRGDNAWAVVNTNLVADTSPQLGGNLDLNGNDITGTGGIPAANLTGSVAAARLTVATTQAESDNSTKLATTAYVTAKITTLIGGAPSTLNDLNELALAINDDANYNSTLTTALATKLPLAGGTMTGAILHSDGSTSAPSISFSADTNTGFYRVGSDKIGTVVGGSLKTTLTSTGLGIGTSAPDTEFHVVGLGTVAKFEATDGPAYINLKDDDGTQGFMGLDAGSFVFQTSGSSYSNKLVITSAGKVGIGVAAPAVTLELAGNGGAIRLPTGGELQFGNANNLIIGNSGSNYLAFKSNGAERMRITDNGTIGIGNTIPNTFNSQANLLVVGTGSGDNGITIYSGSGSGDSGNLFFADGAGASDETRGGISYQHNGNKMQFRVNDANKMEIMSDGKVGIGHTAPPSQLTIQGGVEYRTAPAPGSGTLDIRDTGAEGGAGPVGNHGGGIVLGVTAGSGFCGIKAGLGDGGGNTAGHMKFYTRGATSDTHMSERMRIEYNGRVQINGVQASPDSGGNLVVESNSGNGAAMTLVGDSNVSAGFGNKVVALNFSAKNYLASNNPGIWGQIRAENGNGSYSDRGQLVFATGYGGSTINDHMVLYSEGHLTLGHASNATASQGASSELTFYNNGNFYTISNNSRVTAGSERQTFRSAGTQVGVISAGGSSTSYGTSSDYRLKENVNYTWDATTRLKQLKPARFNWISDDTNTLVDGFIAHEAAVVVPDSVFGIKDAMAPETYYIEGDTLPAGKVIGDVKTYSSSEIKPQQIDQSKLVPLLVKTIQELEARITALEA